MFSGIDRLGDLVEQPADSRLRATLFVPVRVSARDDSQAVSGECVVGFDATFEDDRQAAEGVDIGQVGDGAGRLCGREDPGDRDQQDCQGHEIAGLLVPASSWRPGCGDIGGGRVFGTRVRRRV